MKRTLIKEWWMALWIIILILFFLTTAYAEEWGKTMYPRVTTNIRAKRNPHSPMRGKLEPGKPVKVDFLRDNWYAVFRLSEKKRNERKALGYVYAKLLDDAAKTGASKGTRNKTVSLPREIQDSAPISVKDITFRMGPEGKETVSLELNRYYFPAILILSGETPRIVIDVTHTDHWKKEWSVIDVKGKLIKRIRSSLLKDGKILRVVLDMEPRKNYFVNPVFSEGNHVYSLEVVEDRK